MSSGCSIQLLSKPDFGFDVELSIRDSAISSQLTSNGSVAAIQASITAIVDQETADDRTVAWNVLHSYGPKTVSAYGLNLTEVSVGTRIDRAPTANIPLTTFRK